jgi:transcriptional regulator with XRE-family HTH domain
VNYGRAIRTLCALREMSQQDLAKAMGVEESFVSRTLSKGASPTMKTLEKVATVFDAPVFLIVLLATDDLPAFEKAQAEALGALFLELLVPKQKISARNAPVRRR